MRFPKIVFSIAGVWGLLVLTPLFFLYDLVGKKYPPIVTHPEFYFGFVTVALAWQVVFLVIASDPKRFRPLMIPAMLEKFGYVAALSALYATGQLKFAQIVVIGPDFLLGLFFLAAFLKTR